jgi:CBS domain-containing protein
MTVDPVSCGPGTNIAAAADLMWKYDCGILPVVEDGKLTGVVTDRDICIALGTRNQPAGEVTVANVATQDVKTCSSWDDVHTAMATMRRAKVRRIPVVNHDGHLVGILGLNDIVLTVDRKHGSITYEEVVNTLKAVNEHPVHKSARPFASVAAVG